LTLLINKCSLGKSNKTIMSV